MSELSKFQKTTGEWAASTFKRNCSNKSLLSVHAHLEKEVAELKEMLSKPHPHAYYKTGEDYL
jgi:hypothetical protein